MQYSPLHAFSLFSILSNVHIVDIEYLQGMCSSISATDDFSVLLSHPFSSLITKFEICINNRWYLIRFSVLIKLQYLSVFGSHYNTAKIFIFIYHFMSFKFVFCTKRMNTMQTIKNTRRVLKLFLLTLLIMLEVLMEDNVILFVLNH